MTLRRTRKRTQNEKDQIDVEQGEEKVGIETQQAQLDPGQDDDEEDAHGGQGDFPLPLATFMRGAFLHGNVTR